MIKITIMSYIFTVICSSPWYFRYIGSFESHHMSVGRHYYYHFADVKMWAQRGWVTGSKSHRRQYFVVLQNMGSETRLPRANFHSASV